MKRHDNIYVSNIVFFTSLFIRHQRGMRKARIKMSSFLLYFLFDKQSLTHCTLLFLIKEYVPRKALAS